MSAFLPNLDEVLQIIVFMSPLSALCHSCTLFASLIMFKLKYKAWTGIAKKMLSCLTVAGNSWRLVIMICSQMDFKQVNKEIHGTLQLYITITKPTDSPLMEAILLTFCCFLLSHNFSSLSLSFPLPTPLTALRSCKTILLSLSRVKQYGSQHFQSPLGNIVGHPACRSDLGAIHWECWWLCQFLAAPKCNAPALAQIWVCGGKQRQHPGKYQLRSHHGPMRLLTELSTMVDGCRHQTS